MGRKKRVTIKKIRKNDRIFIVRVIRLLTDSDCILQ